MRNSGMLNSLLSIVGGAGTGAMLMYLFDPERGEKRRQYLSEKAAEAADATGQSLSSGWHTVRDKAGQYGRNAASSFGSVGSTISERPFLHSPTSQILTALGCFALGAGLMYILDPSIGGERRNTIRDKVSSSSKKVGEKIQHGGHDLWTRASQTLHDVRSRLSGQGVNADDQNFANRVRSEISGYVANPDLVEVHAANGVVTLSGHTLKSEFDGLLKCVWGVGGVKDIINRLTIHERSEELPHEVASRSSIDPGI